MNKKIFVLSILAVFVLTTITLSSAINTTNNNKKESPLYSIRTRLAIREKIGQILDNIKTKFLGERLFFIPFKWITTNRGTVIETMYTYKGETCDSPCTACFMTCYTYCTDCQLPHCTAVAC